MSRYAYKTGDAIILVRKQFQQLFKHSLEEEPLRNELLIDLPCQMGLRTKEVGLLRWEGVDTRSGTLTILDSKKHETYPLPMSYDIAEKLDRYRNGHDEGYVFRRLKGASCCYKKQGEPLTNCAIWETWRRIARRAGLEKPKLYNPRLGRHYFAAMWDKNQGSIEMLRRILRHRRLETTQIYLSRLIFYEDIQEEYERVQQIPALHRPKPTRTVTYRTFCYECIHFPVCGFKEDMANCPVAECKQFETRKPNLPDIQFMKPSRVKRNRGQTYY